MRILGKIKEFVEWLQGDQKNQDSHQTSPRIKIKIFNKRLERQIRKMEAKERIAKKEAIKARQEGDKAGARLHMRSSLQYRKWGHSTQKFKNKMENIEFRLEQAKVMGDFSNMAEDLTSTLKGLQQEVSMPEITKLLGELDFGFGKMDSIFDQTTESLEMSEDQSPTAVSDSEVDQALAEIDSEMAVETGLDLPSVPTTTNPEEKLEDLEDEIQKLKKARNL